MAKNGSDIITPMKDLVCSIPSPKSSDFGEFGKGVGGDPGPTPDAVGGGIQYQTGANYPKPGAWSSKITVAGASKAAVGSKE